MCVLDTTIPDLLRILLIVSDELALEIYNIYPSYPVTCQLACVLYKILAFSTLANFACPTNN